MALHVPMGEVGDLDPICCVWVVAVLSPELHGTLAGVLERLGEFPASPDVLLLRLLRYRGLAVLRVHVNFQQLNVLDPHLIRGVFLLAEHS